MRNSGRLLFLIGLVALGCVKRNLPGPAGDAPEADAREVPRVTPDGALSPPAPEVRPAAEASRSGSEDAASRPRDAEEKGSGLDWSGPFCNGTGISPPPDSEGFCALPPPIGDVELNTVPRLYAGTAPACPPDDSPTPAGWRIKVEKVEVRPSGDPASRHFGTVVSGTRLDSQSPCGVALWILLREEKVNLAPGSVVRYAVKHSPNVSYSGTLRDADERLLIGVVRGQRPQIWDAEMFPGITLSLDQQPVCRPRGYKMQQLRAHLRSGTDDCAVECYTRRCCTLGGETLDVRADLAARYEETVGPQQDQVNLLVRRPGVVSPVN